MKKILISILCFSMIASSMSMIAFAKDDVSSETTATEETKITDLNKIYGILEEYLTEKYNDNAMVKFKNIDDEELVNIVFKAPKQDETKFNEGEVKEDMSAFLNKNEIDESAVKVTFLKDRTEEIKNICSILNSYMQENYPELACDYNECVRYSDFSDPVVEVYVGQSNCVDDEKNEEVLDIKENVREFLNKNNVDMSLVTITIAVKEPVKPSETTSETTDPTETGTTATEETTDKIELPTQEITNEPTKETTTEPKEIKLGDINGDDVIDSKDAVLVLKSYAEALANNKTYYEKVADVNNDGKVDLKDAVEILKTYAKNLVGNKN